MLSLTLVHIWIYTKIIYESRVCSWYEQTFQLGNVDQQVRNDSPRTHLQRSINYVCHASVNKSLYALLRCVHTSTRSLILALIPVTSKLLTSSQGNTVRIIAFPKLLSRYVLIARSPLWWKDHISVKKPRYALHRRHGGHQTRPKRDYETCKLVVFIFSFLGLVLFLCDSLHSRQE
jgi:hypothetical protein